MDIKQLDHTTVVVANVCREDWPDFCDAFIESADWLDGTELTEAELEQLNTEHGDIVYDHALDSLR